MNKRTEVAKKYQATVTNSPVVRLKITSSLLQDWNTLQSSYGVARKSFTKTCRIVVRFAMEEIVGEDERLRGHTDILSFKTIGRHDILPDPVCKML